MTAEQPDAMEEQLEEMNHIKWSELMKKRNLRVGTRPLFITLYLRRQRQRQEIEEKEQREDKEDKGRDKETDTRKKERKIKDGKREKYFKVKGPCSLVRKKKLNVKVVRML